MLSVSRLILSLVLAGTALAGQVQNPSIVLPSSARTHQEAVVQIFNESYQSYREFAFGHDDLSPLSQSFSDPLNGWGATIVDALDTLFLMGMDDLFLEAVNFSSQIDYSVSKTSDTVSVFETTIRHVGGLLSAYELSGQKFPILVTKAKQVADQLAFAWVGSNDVPFGELDFSTHPPTPQIATSNIAEAGTLTLEFATLSKYTGNQTYADLALKSVTHIANLPAPLPGLAAQGIDPSSGEFVDGFVSWGGGSDSYFEYLIKFARLSNTDDNLFADTWHTAADSSIKFLRRTSTVGNFVYLADFEDGTIFHEGSHLACYYGGNWLLAGRLMNNQTIVNVALDLVDACWNTYAGDATGIGPETFAFISSDGNFTGSTITPEQLAFYDKHGYYITGSDYINRPEVLESNFYAYRVTGDQKYLDRAASAINSFNKFLKTPTGFSGINDVNNPNTTKIDDTPSFWFAEVLKYLYLTFDDPKRISLDNFVFNTESHPFIAPPAKPVYGSGKILASNGPFKAQAGPPLPAVSPSVKQPQGVKVPSQANSPQ